MIKLVNVDEAGTTSAELTLLNANNRPTVLLIGLAALEIAFDVFVGYTAYRIFKGK